MIVVKGIRQIARFFQCLLEICRTKRFLIFRCLWRRSRQQVFPKWNTQLICHFCRRSGQHLRHAQGLAILRLWASNACPATAFLLD